MIGRVLAALDFSPISARVVELAAELALGNRASLTLLHVAAPEPDFVGYAIGPQHERDERAKELREEHRDLEQRASQLRERGIDAHFVLVQGPTVETILREADERKADLIVIGAHGRTRLARMLLGSVSEGVLKGARCAVTVLPPHD